MDQVHRIRELFYEQGKNLAEIAEIMSCDWRTVRKYVDKDDFSPRPPEPDSGTAHRSKIDCYKPLIDKWLIDDKKAPRKQRHTAKRVYHRLRQEAEGFDASYRLVAQYVSARKKELALTGNEAYIPLIHHPGEAQGDFGFADFYENGKLHHEAKYLVLSFPYSNGGYLQLNYGENLECLLEGLQAIFEYIGGVPTEIWFDNTRTIVTEVIRGGGRNIVQRFSLFAEHYRFKPVFMNPDSGNEKGNVENKVGYLRRNELVPVPRFNTLAEENAQLLKNCDKDMEREHYDKDQPISELFKEDASALLPLPPVRFDTSRYESVSTDKYGRFTLDNGKYRYSASPAFCNDSVNLKITSAEVIVMDADMKEVVRHRRLYSGEKESMEWLPYLRYIARKPRSLKNSGIYAMMPATLQAFMDDCPNAERGKILKVLAELTDRSGFESALHTIEEAVHFQATDPDSLMSLYNRIYADTPVLPPLPHSAALPSAKVIPINTDLKKLDQVLKGGVVNG